MVYIARAHIAHDWIFLLLLTFVFLFASFKNMYSDRFYRFFAWSDSAPYVSHYRHKKYRRFHFFRIVIGPSLLLGLVLFTVFKRAHPSAIRGFSDATLFLSTTACLLLFQLLQAVFHLFFSSFFDLEVLGDVYLHTKYHLLFVSGIPFIPLLFLVYYSPIPYWVILDVLIAYTIFYLGFWQVFIALAHWKYSKGGGYFFLYLCTLEILPLLWVAKFLFL